MRPTIRFTADFANCFADWDNIIAGGTAHGRAARSLSWCAEQQLATSPKIE